jgi:hypothetical protein
MSHEYVSNRPVCHLSCLSPVLSVLNQPVLFGFPLFTIPFAESASGRCASREMPEYTWPSVRPPQVGPRRFRTQPNQTGGVEVETWPAIG